MKPAPPVTSIFIELHNNRRRRPARFTDRHGQRNLVRFWLNSPTEPPLLVFYGIGGAGNRDENLRRAIDCYEAALRIRTEQAFPSEHQQTLSNLAAAQAALGALQRP